MKRIWIYLMLLALATPLWFGCTSQSTLAAQKGSFETQVVKDGIHRNMFIALSRSNYEIARQAIELAGDDLKARLPEDQQQFVDEMVAASAAALEEFGRQRDFMVVWDRDYERANTMKAVTVDAKLFSEEGILNYLGRTLSDASKKLLKSWDGAQPTSRPALE
ncbi:MAG: hypothetical protein KKB31_07810 [Nanoarchaeota archaeon]|nr:hypothetical protein [Nanoarchaeota archaeon]